MSNRVVREYLSCLDYEDRRGRKNLSAMDEERKVRICRFFLETYKVRALKQNGEAVLVDMDESFVQRTRSFSYSYFLKNGRERYRTVLGGLQERG